MIVTDIVENSETFEIYIDDEYKYTISEQVLNKYEIEIGKKVGYMEDMYIQKKSLDYECMNKAIKKLSYNQRTTKEMMVYFKEKGYEESLSERIVVKLIELGYLDDLTYAINYLIYQSKNRLKSKTVALYNLRGKGISQNIAEKAMEEVECQIDDDCAIMKLLNKKVKNVNDLKDKKTREKVKMFLYRKGFNLNRINKALNEFEESEI